ncbi:rCG52554 [Rattus norvegicus]|uniref:RCG52554 n=1 Tax=Rattus norvegicus TaxID=10116 RepID=A6IRP6_RAT|nr:rCG52554 [Rattus norvegicus]
MKTTHNPQTTRNTEVTTTLSASSSEQVQVETTSQTALSPDTTTTSHAPREKAHLQVHPPQKSPQ